MKVQELLDLVKVKLQNLPIATNTSILISFLNMGMNELYRRFNLSVKSETIVVTTDLALYELRNDDVQMILAVYDKFGKELTQSDVLDSLDYDYKIVNYRSFVLRKPFEGYLYAVYKASPVKLVDGNDEVDLPESMVNALLTYVAYMANNTINRDNMQESANHYQIFKEQCLDLEMQGYKIPLNTEKVAVQARGFV